MAKYIFFTFNGHGLPIAGKLQEEGNEVLVGQVDNGIKIKIKEEPEIRERRLEIGNGIFKKKDADQLLEVLLKLPKEKRDDYFVICDFNDLYRYGEPLIEAGFNGLLVTREDVSFEQDRFKAKEYVKKNYPYLSPPETYEFKTIKDGITFLKETDEIFVLKGNYEETATIVPKSTDIQEAKEELIEMLERNQKDYERQGFILERKIVNGIEFVPEATFYNGKLLSVVIDIENKYLGAGNTGYQTGCSQDLNFVLDLDHPVYEMFLKPLEKIAQQKKGLFIGDAGVIWDIDRQRFYFLEMCFQRWGYNAIFTELSLFDRVSDYFERAKNGLPLYDYQKNQPTFGASVRIFNLLEKEGKILKDIKIQVKNPKFVWLWDTKKEGKDYLNCGYDINLAVITGRGFNYYDSIKDCYENLNRNFYFPEMYYRPEFDFLSEEYANSISQRFHFFQNFDWERYLKNHENRTNNQNIS